VWLLCSNTFEQKASCGLSRCAPIEAASAWRETIHFPLQKNDCRTCQLQTINASFSRMKCPVCELFGRELHFQTRRLLDQHSSRFHGLSAAQLEARAHGDRLEVAEANRSSEKSEALRARRLLH
jgi:hypothetical protein